MSIVDNKYIISALSDEQVSKLIEIYIGANSYISDSMKKLTSKNHNMEEVYEILRESDIIDVDRIAVCHFYCHDSPYYPHTDFHSKEKENLVLPLKVIDGPNPYLVVFDQYYNGDGRTWTFNKNLDFDFNKSAKCRPCDFGKDIHGLLEQDISEDLYNYLNHFPKKYWYGLSGTAYEFKPGNAIQFDSKKIHSTSRMFCKEKLGLTIRYSF